MQSLKYQAVSGVKWNSLSTFTVIIAEFARIAVLAHFLLPEDFGLFGMIIVVLGLAQTFSDMGISNAVIYKQDSTREQLSSLYWLNVFSGVAVFLILLLITPLAEIFFREGRLGYLLPLAAVNFLIAPLGQQFSLLLQKELEFKKLSFIEIATNMLNLAVSVSLAVLGYGVYSIIWGSISGSAFGTVWLLSVGLKRWKPSFHFALQDLKGYLSFGIYQMGERSLNYLSANVDYVFVGRFLGAELLGVYMIAYQLVVKPLVRLNPILTRVAFPIFSKRQTDDFALRRGYLELIKFVSFATFPVLLGLLAVSKLFIPVVYGLKWSMAIPLVQILVIVGIIKSLGNPAGSILLAKGRADIGFKWNLFVAALNTAVFFIVSRYSVFHVAWSWFFLSVFYFLVGWMILKKVIGLLLTEYLKVIVSPFILSAIMSMLVWIAYLAISATSMNDVLALSGLVFTGCLFYSVLLLLFERPYLHEMWDLLLGREGGK